MGGRDSKGRFLKGNNEFSGKTHSENTKDKIRESVKEAWKDGKLKGYPKGRKNKKLSETRKRLFKEGKLPSLSGKNNPMYGKKANKKQLAGLKLGRRTGKDCNFWKGGITVLRIQIINSQEYHQWRKEVFKRDNYTCQDCTIRSKPGLSIYLGAHHIKSFSKILEGNNILSLEDAINCKELWDITNGKTLCKECHKKTDNFANHTKYHK